MIFFIFEKDLRKKRGFFDKSIRDWRFIGEIWYDFGKKKVNGGPDKVARDKVQINDFRSTYLIQ